MTETDLLMFALAFLQPVMLGFLSFIAFRDLRALDNHLVPERRAANHRIRAGLAMIGLGCFGRFLLSSRSLIIKILVYNAHPKRFLNLPEPLVESANTISTLVAIAGIFLVLRGLRQVLFRESAGQDDQGAPGGFKALVLIVLIVLFILDLKLTP